MPRFLASNTVDSSSLSTSVSLRIRLVLRNLPEIKFRFHYEQSVFAPRHTNNNARWYRTKSLPIEKNFEQFCAISETSSDGNLVPRVLVPLTSGQERESLVKSKKVRIC